MKNACTKWNDQLLEAALAETAGAELLDHLAHCADCAAELERLRARRQQMDSLLPLIARAEEPSPELHARILAAAESPVAHRRLSGWRVWALAGVVAMIVVAGVISWERERDRGMMAADLRKAQALAEWRAPTDSFLRIPGQELLNSTPRLGESFIKIPMDTEKGGSK